MDQGQILRATSIDYPAEEEVVPSSNYTARIKAPLNAEKVEIAVDGADWALCRYSSGFWWYDLSSLTEGTHEIVARILPFDSHSYALRTRRFSVKYASTPANVDTPYTIIKEMLEDESAEGFSSDLIARANAVLAQEPKP